MHILFPKVIIKKSFKEMKNMVAKEVLRMPNAASFEITLVASKTLLSCHLFNEYHGGEGVLRFSRVKNSIKPC
jgi:hypothetical protein